MRTWQLLKERVLSKSPKFMNKLRAVALWVGGNCVVLMAGNTALSLEVDVHYPIVYKIIQVTTFICVGIAGTATLTTKDPNLSKE